MDRVPERVGWIGKFANAFRGIRVGVRGQSSFAVHFLAMAVVVATIVYLQIDLLRSAVLLLCIAGVLVCELINSSLEKLAKSITKEFDHNVRDSLDIASGAVMLASIFAVAIGALVLVESFLVRS